jgi:hypothetical protein
MPSHATSTNDEFRLPPGPHSNPLSILQSTYRFSFEPVAAYGDWVAQYGPVFMLPMLDGKTVCIGRETMTLSPVGGVRMRIEGLR